MDLRQQTGDGAAQRLAATLIAQPHAADVAVELTAFDEVVQGELADRLRAAVLDGLGLDQRPGEPTGQQGPAKAHSRRQALACRADVDDPFGSETLHGPQAALLVAVLGVEIVLDDQPLALLRPLDQGGTALATEHGAGRELVRRGDDDRAGPRGGEGVDADAVGVDRHRHDFEPRPLDDQAMAVPTRVLQRDALHPTAGQPAAEQREGLVEAGADQYLPAHRGERDSRRRRSAPGARPPAAIATSGRGEIPPGRANQDGSGRGSWAASSGRAGAPPPFAPCAQPVPAPPAWSRGTPRRRAGCRPR